jgi:uncharacterized repeat protein (TIGR01451 family)
LVTAAVTVTDHLPSGFLYVTNTGNGTYNAASGQWTVALGASGTTASQSITVQAAAAGLYTNTATITIFWGVSDPNPANNTASATVLVTAQADLAITTRASASSALIGDHVTFTVSILNNGPDPVPSTVTATDLLPSAQIIA